MFDPNFIQNDILFEYGGSMRFMLPNNMLINVPIICYIQQFGIEMLSMNFFGDSNCSLLHTLPVPERLRLEFFQTCY